MSAPVVVTSTPTTLVVTDKTDVLVVSSPAQGPQGSRGPQGVQGDPGVQGPQGPQGAQGIASGFFIYAQQIPDTVWEIQHPLEYYPAVTVVDSANTVVLGSIEYPELGVVRLTFSAPFSGTAYLS